MAIEVAKKNANEVAIEEEEEESPCGSVSPADFQAAWNRLPSQFPKIKTFTEKRKRALRARSTDASWRANWKEALERMAASKFCQGDNNNGWRAGPDWFLTEDAQVKILEGNYDDRKATNGRNNANPKTGPHTTYTPGDENHNIFD